MPFGRRRFLGLDASDWRARFAPMELGEPMEHVSEADLRRALDDNDQTASPLYDGEEVEALRAFDRRAGARTARRPNNEPAPTKTR